MNFEKWFESISKESLSEKSLKELLKMAYIEGAMALEKEMPLYGVNVETGKIVELPREDNTPLPEGEKWCDEDFDLEDWLKSKDGEKDESK